MEVCCRLNLELPIAWAGPLGLPIRGPLGRGIKGCSRFAPSAEVGGQGGEGVMLPRGVS